MRSITHFHPRPELRRAYVAPSNKLEQTIADMWQKLLGIDQIGIDDSFFDLGGHSLRAVQVGARLQEIFPIELPLRVFFEAPSVAALAERIELIGRAAGIDVTIIATMFLQLRRLSDDQVAAMLAQGLEDRKNIS